MLRGETRARLHEARVALGDRDGETRSARAPARPARARHARTPRGRARRRPRTHAPGRTASGRSCLTGSSIRPSPGRTSSTRGVGRVGDQVRREARQVAPREARDHEHAVRRCPRAPRSACRARRAPTGGRRRRTGRACARAPSDPRSARASSAFSSSSPSPVERRDLRRSGERFASRRRPSGSTRSILFRTSSTGNSSGADLVQDVVDRLTWRSCSSSAADASTTCSTMSASSVSSSVDGEALDELRAAAGG